MYTSSRCYLFILITFIYSYILWYGMTITLQYVERRSKELLDTYAPEFKHERITFKFRRFANIDGITYGYCISTPNDNIIAFADFTQYKSEFVFDGLLWHELCHVLERVIYGTKSNHGEPFLRLYHRLPYGLMRNFLLCGSLKV